MKTTKTPWFKEWWWVSILVIIGLSVLPLTLLLLPFVLLFLIWKKTTWKRQIKVWLSLIGFIFFCALAIAVNKNWESNIKNIPQNIQENEEINSWEIKKSIPEEQDIQLIKVNTDFQDIINWKQKIVVWTENTWKTIFSGDLRVNIFSNVDNTSLGNETVYIKELIPWQKTYAIIWSKTGTSLDSKYSWSNTKFQADVTSDKKTDSTYKLLNTKKEPGWTLVPQIDLYLATDRDFEKMYNFLKGKKINKWIFYHAVFVDDEKFGTFSQYPITAMTFDEDQSKHIVAKYWFNTLNGNKEFSYYEKNSWESVAKYRKD